MSIQNAIDNISSDSEMRSRTKRHLNPARVLVVEDDDCLTPLIERAIFDIEGEPEIFWAISLEEAVAKFIQCADLSQKEPYDLIIADIFLEGPGTGLDLFKVIHGTYPKIPFLVTSSISYEQVLANIPPQYTHNMSYLRKPFLFAQCKEQIGNLLIRR